MKLFKIVFKEYSYDEYDSFLIVAKDAHSALEAIKAYPYTLCINWESGYTVTEVIPSKYKKATIILGSFNAG